MVFRIGQMVKRFFTDPVIRFGYYTKLGLYDRMDDESFLKKKYHIVTGKNLNLDNPKLFNEKIQWLKIHDRDEAYTNMVDKFAVKDYVANRIGNEYIIPTLGVWNSFEEIDFTQLPNQFVLKCTHDSGSVVICKDKKQMNLAQLRKKFNRSLKRNYYYEDREWSYKGVKPRILAEKYLEDESGKELKDYKFFCFNGEPKLVQVDFGRFDEHKRNIYTPDWQYVDATIKYPNDASVKIERPQRLDVMLDIAATLSQNIPHVRVDLYSIGTNIYFGELTFYHGGGTEKISPASLEKQMGDWIELHTLGKGID